MPTRNYEPAPDFFAKLGQSPAMKRITMEVAEKARVIAEGLAEDIRSDNNDPGHVHYADSFETSQHDIFIGDDTTPRTSARVTNTAPHAAAVEWGYKGRADSETSTAHRVLGRTLAALEGSSE